MLEALEDYLRECEDLDKFERAVSLLTLYEVHEDEVALLIAKYFEPLLVEARK